MNTWEYYSNILCFNYYYIILISQFEYLRKKDILKSKKKGYFFYIEEKFPFAIYWKFNYTTSCNRLLFWNSIRNQSFKDMVPFYSLITKRLAMPSLLLFILFQILDKNVSNETLHIVKMQIPRESNSSNYGHRVLSTLHKSGNFWFTALKNNIPWG